MLPLRTTLLSVLATAFLSGGSFAAEAQAPEEPSAGAPRMALVQGSYDFIKYAPGEQWNNVAIYTLED